MFLAILGYRNLSYSNLYQLYGKNKASDFTLSTRQDGFCHTCSPRFQKIIYQSIESDNVIIGKGEKVRRDEPNIYCIYVDWPRKKTALSQKAKKMVS